ncbi:MAG: hypothetical protein GF355_10745 [Candidatus Eisenbacteria bacterium]|nr:hypothetical protein [Candidatus Eisenbacteria bacterium]
MAADIWEGLLLGLIQGLTEFLPVSSSGHLVLAQHFLGVDEPGVVLEIVLHLGTVIAVVLHYRCDLARLITGTLRFLARRKAGQAEARYAGLLALGTVPVVLVGVTLRGAVESAFQSPSAAALFLFLAGLFLTATRWFRRGERETGPGAAFVMGLFQVVALLPGVSRSGMTIGGGLLARLHPQEAARFSFLLSLPAILGATILHLPGMTRASATGAWPVYVGGFLVAAASGYLAIATLLRVLRRGHLAPFGVYCIMVGLVMLWAL